MDANGASVGDLVVHQGDERGDNDGNALAHQGGDLVAQGFAAACGHQHEGAAALGDGVNDLGLVAAKIGVAEGVLKDLLGGGHGAVGKMGNGGILALGQPENGLLVFRLPWGISGAG